MSIYVNPPQQQLSEGGWSLVEKNYDCKREQPKENQK